jgi:hypothetical protein
LLDAGHGGARAARIVGVHHDQVILHLDDNVVAVPLVRIAFQEPDTGDHDADGAGRGVGARDQQRDAAQRGER